MSELTGLFKSRHEKRTGTGKLTITPDYSGDIFAVNFLNHNQMIDLQKSFMGKSRLYKVLKSNDRSTTFAATMKNRIFLENRKKSPFKGTRKV